MLMPSVNLAFAHAQEPVEKYAKRALGSRHTDVVVE
jgi:hypothetical protein